MKIPALILIFVCAFSACARFEEFNRVAEQKIEIVNHPFEQPENPPILEITRDAEGMQDVTGKSLFFNLYNDGIVEFEVRDAKKKAAEDIGDAGEINVLQRAKISERELRNFTDLLASEDFQITKNEYERDCAVSDVSFKYHITFATANDQKIINLNDGCGSSSLENQQFGGNKNFPKVLTELLILAEKTRQKYAAQ